MSIVKDLMGMSISTIINMVLGFIYFPVLTQLFSYSAAVFGRLQLIQSLATIIVSFSILSIDLAFISSKREHSSKECSQAFSAIITSGVTVLSLSIALLYSMNFFGFVELDLGIVISVFAMGTATIIERAFFALFKDKRLFGEIAISGIIRSFAVPTFGIVISLFMRNEYVLAISYTASHIISAVFFLLRTKKHNLIIELKFSIRLVIKTVLAEKNVTFFATATGLVNNLYHNIPVFLIKSLFDASLLGFYSISMRLLGTANRLLSLALYETFLPYFSKSEEHRSKIISLFPALASVFFLFFLPISLLSDWYVPMLFGTDFTPVAHVISVIVAWLFSQTLVGPYTGIPLVYRRSDITLKLNIVALFARILGFYFGKALAGYEGALYSIAFVSMFVYQTYLYFALKLSKQLSWRQPGILLLYQAGLVLTSIPGIAKYLSCLFLVPAVIIINRNREVFLRIKASFRRRKNRSEEA